MRYSLGALFVATAYVALIATAIRTDSAFFADMAWAATFLVFAYAVVVACIAKNRRRALSIGFVVVALGNFTVQYVAPYKLPEAYLLRPFGYMLTPDGVLVVESTRSAGTAGGRLTTFRGAKRGRQVFRAANAASTLSAGLIGCGIGALAYRHSREP